MRLICPNCDAEYEVDASVIPEAGRDVQCSNCGHTWFQMPLDLGPALIGDDEEAPAPQVGEPAPAEPSAESEPPPVATTTEDVAPVVPPPAEPVPARPRALEESMLSVLREEAEREAAARRAEAPQPIETQTDLALTPPPLTRAEPDPVTSPAPVETVSDDTATRSHRRDLLPDVEEINSTLRPVEDGGEGDDETDDSEQDKARGGFGSGFALMLILACAIVAVYVLAPKLAEQIPAARPALEQFVAAVDGLRLWLDGLMKSVIGAIDGNS